MGVFSSLGRRLRGRLGGQGAEFLRYLGPGLLVTVGFIDPGNWAANVAAGSRYGYTLLWVVTVSTAMLIILQHNAAHLGIATGLCLSEACTRHMRPWSARAVLGSAVLASVSTALAELLGAAIGLRMLFGLPLPVGATLAATFALVMLFTNSYRRIERWIVVFVSLIGLGFLYELGLVRLDWSTAAVSWVRPAVPDGAMVIVMSVLGAVVMPHNLFLHSEIIQSRRWNLEDESVIRRQLRYEFLDTLLSMVVGWGVNSAMVLLAAAAFFAEGKVVTELEQAQALLSRMLGGASAGVFAVALLLSGCASSVTAGMAGGSVFAGLFGRAYDVRDKRTRQGIAITVLGGLGAVLLVGDPFRGLIVSQVLLSVQLPWTVFAQVRLTSSRAVMGKHVNTALHSAVLWLIAATVTVLNALLLWHVVGG